jgi:hypothetical protein
VFILHNALAGAGIPEEAARDLDDVRDLSVDSTEGPHLERYGPSVIG